jgi:hypothetical protein
MIRGFSATFAATSLTTSSNSRLRTVIDFAAARWSSAAQ